MAGPDEQADETQFTETDTVADLAAPKSVEPVDWSEILGKKPELTSVYLKNNPIIPREVVVAYYNYALMINNKSRKQQKKEEKLFLQDYVVNQPWLQANQEGNNRFGLFAENHDSRKLSSTPQPSTSRRDRAINPVMHTPTFGRSVSEASLDSSIHAVNLSKLAKRPEDFDGRKPLTARRWIDDYEKAARKNRWSESSMVQYLPTFLSKEADDWYDEIALKKLEEDHSWSDLRALFLRHFLGESDQLAVLKQIEDFRQNNEESIATFIPKFLRLVRTVQPNKPDAELVVMIKNKLRPSYHTLLSISIVETLEDLNEVCLKIEAGERDTKQASKSRTFRLDSKEIKQKPDMYRPKSTKNDTKVSSKSQPSTPKTSIVCYKCDREGHISPACTFNTKKDGSELNKIKPRKPATRKVVNTVQEAPKPTDVSQTKAVVTVRPAGKYHVCSILPRNMCEVTSLVVGGGGLLTQDILCNEHAVKSIIDTGAFVSVIDAEVAKSHKWKIEENGIQLVHAAGEDLGCIGHVTLKIELRLGRKSMKTTHNVMVVGKLCAPMLLGLELLRALDVLIDPKDDNRPLKFRKQAVTCGLNVSRKQIIPPRCIKFVEARVDTDERFIATIPFGFDNSLLIANSVNVVNNNVTHILIANIDTVSVEISAGQRVATFEPVLDTTKSNIVQSINGVLQICETDDVVCVGDNLNEYQVEELSTLIKKHEKAFSISGKLGLTPQIEHKIELLPESRPFVEPMRRHPKVHVDEARRQVKDMLEEGVIEESASPWASEYVMVRKKTGDWRLCVDFRKLNNLTKKDCYPLPNLESCLEMLAGNNYYSQLDFASGRCQ